MCEYEAESFYYSTGNLARIEVLEDALNHLAEHIMKQIRKHG